MGWGWDVDGGGFCGFEVGDLCCDFGVSIFKRAQFFEQGGGAAEFGDGVGGVGYGFSDGGKLGAVRGDGGIG